MEVIDRFVSNVVLYFLILPQDFHPWIVVNAEPCKYYLKLIRHRGLDKLDNLLSIFYRIVIGWNFKNGPVYMEHHCHTFAKLLG